MFHLFFKQFVFLFAFILFGYVVGRAILRNFSFSHLAEECAFSIALGWGFLAFLMMFLGFLGWFQQSKLVIAVVVAFALCSCAIIRNNYFNFYHMDCSFKNNLSLSFFTKSSPFILLYFVLLFFLSAYPITEWDAISYHLPVARGFISQGEIVPIPFIRFPVNPQIIEMFFALAPFFGETLFANLISYAMAIVLFLLIYSFGQRYFNKEIGLFSAFVFLSSPIVLKLAAIPYLEIGTTLFCFSAFYALCIWLTEKKLSYGMLSAIFWGLAFGTKYYAILFFLTTFLAIIIIFNKKVKFNHAIFFLLLSVLISFPWYFRNKIYSGDWFFPLCTNEKIITGIWSSTEVSSHLNYLRSFGLGKSIKLLFMLPINLLCHSNRFQGSIGPFILMGFGSLLFIKKWSLLIAACVIIVISYTLFWFCNFQVIRYLFPVFPILSLLGGWTLQNVNGYFNIKKQYFWNCLIITVLLFGYLNCIKLIGDNGPIPVTNSERFEYLAKRIPTYKAINFLNSIEQKNIVVYALFDEGSVFYHKNKVIGDWYGPAAYKNISYYIESPILLYSALKGYGVNYLLINRNKFYGGLPLFESELFKLVYRDQNAGIFEIL